MLNEKLNSERRSITHQVSTEKFQIILTRDEENKYSLRRGDSVEALSSHSSGKIVVDTIYSLVHPIGLADRQDMYLCLGKQPETENISIVLSSVPASRVVTPVPWSQKIAKKGLLSQAELLRSTAMH